MNDERRSLFRFRMWPVYEAGKSFRKKIRKLARGLPKIERYLLRDQISRAADSICLNIAEGSNNIVGCGIQQVLEHFRNFPGGGNKLFGLTIGRWSY